MLYLDMRHLIFQVSWHAFILILRHFSFIIILWNFKFIVVNRKHIQTEKMLKFFQKKKTYLTSILVKLRMSLKVVFTYIILFFFFWKSLKVFEISLILLSFLKNFSSKIRKSPLEFLYSPWLWVWVTCGKHASVVWEVPTAGQLLVLFSYDKAGIY